jgi:hypothetical protein
MRYAALLVVAAQSAVMSGCFVSKCPDSTPPDGGTPTTNKDNCVEFTLPRIYEGNTVQQNATWSPGGTIIVSNANGDITVSPTGASGGGVVVSGVPFDSEPANDQGKAAATSVLNGMSKYDIGTDAAGTVTVGGRASGRTGWHLTVTIPSDFNSVLDIRESNGSVSVAGAAGATQTKIVSDNGPIHATNLKNSVYVLGKGAGSVDVSGAPLGGGNLVQADVGDVTFTNAGADLSITATATSGQVKLPSPLPAGWGVGGASPSQTIQIGTATANVLLLQTTSMGDITVQ